MSAGAAPESPLVLVLRPEPGAGATLATARALGLDAESFPLFTIAPTRWDPPDTAEIDALVLGSANALRHGGLALERFRGFPAYVVGEKTAEAAREAGLEVFRIGKGGLQSVLDTLDPAHSRLLRLAGRERVELSLPPGTTMTTCEVYASEPLPENAKLRAALSGSPRRPCIALLHSGEAATRFEALCRVWSIPTGDVHLAAIGPRVSARLNAGWASVRNASAPNDAALLALAAQMCQEVGRGSTQADNHT